MHANDLKTQLAGGLLSFPVTAFDASYNFDSKAHAALVDRLSRYDAAGFFVAGGTGEFFSLTPDEVISSLKVAREVVTDVPIICGTGYGTRMAIEIAKEAQEAGADGVLLLPHYLISASQNGLYEHVRAVCEAINIGVIVYNRDNCILQPDTLVRLAEECDNLIGFKDGSGRIDLVTEICSKLENRFVFVGGMPTAELYADAYKGVGMTTYSSAVFNFLPDLALDFFNAHRDGDTETTDALLRSFFFPFSRIRDRKPGYAVSIIKAGMRLTGQAAGSVRPPLTDLDEEEHDLLAGLISKTKSNKQEL